MSKQTYKVNLRFRETEKEIVSDIQTLANFDTRTNDRNFSMNDKFVEACRLYVNLPENKKKLRLQKNYTNNFKKQKSL